MGKFYFVDIKSSNKNIAVNTSSNYKTAYCEYTLTSACKNYSIFSFLFGILLKNCYIQIYLLETQCKYTTSHIAVKLWVTLLLKLELSVMKMHQSYCFVSAIHCVICNSYLYQQMKVENHMHFTNSTKVYINKIFERKSENIFLPH